MSPYLWYNCCSTVEGFQLSGARSDRELSPTAFPPPLPSCHSFLMSPIIFYDLVTRAGGAIWSPNTWKTRLSLLHKGVDFETRELTITELRGMASRWGVKRPMGE